MEFAVGNLHHDQFTLLSGQTDYNAVCSYFIFVSLTIKKLYSIQNRGMKM